LTTNKNNMNSHNQKSALVLCGLCALALIVEAQPYYTNSNKQAGPYQYNDNEKTFRQITVVRTNQANAGIYTGGFGGIGATNSLTITFPHAYLSAPVVMLNLTNATVPVYPSAVTPSNCVANFNTGTNVGGTFITIGAP
jgi:hypothetical protein